MAFYVPIGCVRFAGYCGEMYSRHYFACGGLIPASACCQVSNLLGIFSYERDEAACLTSVKRGKALVLAASRDCFMYSLRQTPIET